jgi:hypothetical protein
MEYSRITAPLDSIMLCEPLAVYKSVRVQNTAFKTVYMPALIRAYDLEGVGCAQFANIEGKCRSWAHAHLALLVSRGFMLKRDKKYYLTDLGLKVVKDAKREASVMINRVRREFTKRARQRLR